MWWLLVWLGLKVDHSTTWLGHDPVPWQDNTLEFEERLARDPSIALHKFELKQLLPEPGKPERTRVHARKLVDLLARLRSSQLAKAIADARAALDVLDALARERPDHQKIYADREADALARLAEVYDLAREGEPLEPLAVKPKARWSPEEREARRDRGEAAFLAGDYERACYELECLAANDPGDMETKDRLTLMKETKDRENYRSTAEMHARLGRRAEAVECYERLLRGSPGDARALTRLAELRSEPRS